MFQWNKLLGKKRKNDKEEVYPFIDVTIDDVRQAIKEFAKTMPLDVSLRSLVKEDHSLDYQILKSVLKGIPTRTFYMSKETFEVFDEQKLAQAIDHVQVAVDQYRTANDDWPIIPGNKERKISYFLIKDYLRKEPDVVLYLDGKDNMVTHRRPNS